MADEIKESNVLSAVAMETTFVEAGMGVDGRLGADLQFYTLAVAYSYPSTM
jgi:hypothetical protein